MARTALDAFFGKEERKDAGDIEGDIRVGTNIKIENDSLEEGSEEVEVGDENADDVEVGDGSEDGEDNLENEEDSHEEDPEEGEGDETGEADDEGSKELEEARDKITNLEKRVKDNRTSYLKEHELRLALEAELKDLKAKAKEGGDSWFDDDEGQGSKTNSETEALRKEVEQLRATREEQERERALNEFKEKEALFKKEHSDYDDMYQFLEAVYKTRPDVQAKFAEMGKTPEAVYELGREIQAELDPEGHKEYLRRKIKKSKAEKNKTKKESLKKLEGSSKRPKSEPKTSQKAASAVDAVFGKKRR